MIKNEAYAKILFPARAKTATERKKKKRKKKDNYKAFLFSRKSKKERKTIEKFFALHTNGIKASPILSALHANATNCILFWAISI